MDRSRVPTSGVIRGKKVTVFKINFPLLNANENLQLERLPSQEGDTKNKN